MSSHTRASKYPRAYVCISHSPLMSIPKLAEAGVQFRKHMEETKGFIKEFAPALVVMFAPDHMNLYEHVRPPFAAILSATTLPEFGVEKLSLNIDTDLASKACLYLGENDIDIAGAEDVEVDHGLSLTLIQLFESPESVPLLPFVMNVINFPLSPLRRSLRLGSLVGNYLADFEGSVLFIGTGGLSHNPPFPPAVVGSKKLTADERQESLANALGWIDPVWDEEMLDNMRAGNSDWLINLSQSEIDLRGGGANEIRVWGAAWAACGYSPALITAYESVPEWITGMGIAIGDLPGSVNGR